MSSFPSLFGHLTSHAKETTTQGLGSVDKLSMETYTDTDTAEVSN